MTRVFGWLCDHSGCGYYRVKQPFNAMRAKGHDVFYDGNMPPDIALGGADVILAQRVVLEGPTEWIQKTARKGTTKIVIELDDDLWNIEGTNAIAHSFFNLEMQERAKQNLAVADQVTTTTDHLAERLSEYTTAPIEVIPNHVSQWLVEHEPERNPDFVTVGWAGSATHVGDWAELSSELRRFLKRVPGVELHTMGHNLAQGWPQNRHSWWRDKIDDYLRDIDFHVGLAPLRPSLFNKSKSALKAMEYGALGIPVIASNCGPYATYVQHGETGFLVDRPHEWAIYLRELVGDRTLRETMGQKARAYVSANSLMEDNTWRWEKVLSL